MTSYQDVLSAAGVSDSWAFSESSGTDFAPWIGPLHLTGHGSILGYQQAGPFANSLSLHLANGGYVTFDFPFSPAPSAGFAVWYKPNAFPVTAQGAIIDTGSAPSSGTGIVFNSSGQLQYNINGVSTTNTGFSIPDGNWHHYGLTAILGASQIASISFDGNAIWQGSFSGSRAPSPNGAGILQDRGGTLGAIEGGYIAYPAWWINAPDPLVFKAAYVAATDPTQALSILTTGSSILQQILNAVQKTFPST